MKFFVRKALHVLAAGIAVSLPACVQEVSGCTAAIVSARASASGRPLLWKNRDTSAIDNKVEYIAAAHPGELAFVALFNASDRDCLEAWAGMNSAGFAVMNTASYNLNDGKVPQKDMDREGYVMTLALKHCRSVDDFESLLSSLPRPMGVEANFGVMDASGAGAFFETGNDFFTRYDLADAADGVLVRTNYSHSGRLGEGFGQIRERNALELLRPYMGHASLSPSVFTEELSCSFYHSLHGRDMLASDAEWIVDQDFIPRFTTTASVVIEGVVPAERIMEDSGRDYVMWTALGYPPCAEVVPVWCDPQGVDPELRGLEEDGTSAMCNRAKARKAEVFCAPDGNASRYIYVPALCGDKGYLSRFRRLNYETYAKLRRH